MDYPYLKPMRTYEEMQDAFLGYNHNLRIGGNEWYDMENVSPRCFPMFAPREPRGVVRTLTAPQGLIARDALVYVDGATLYINHVAVAGLVLTTTAGTIPKQLISMGAYIIIMPDKKYVNTADLSDYGSIESEFSFTGNVAYTPARVDGTDMTFTSTGATPPAAPANGEYWVDTSDILGDVLRQYSAMSDTWTEIPSTYTKIALTGIGSFFEIYDGVEIAGCAYSGADVSLTAQIPLLNGSHVIYAVSANYIIVSGILTKVHTQTGATVTVKRLMPAMDFITESENRLWGCKYGFVNSETVNEIYACAQGDFKNWNKFLGISTDSYAASVGTDGKFTGAVTHLGYPLFFKENCLHKVYGSMPSNYRIDTVTCRGVQEGSAKSLAIVNELLFYKGRTEVLVYDGSLPVGVSEALGAATYRAAVGGAYKDRYYISMTDGTAYSLFFFDTTNRLWYREDAMKAAAFAQLDDDLYFIDDTTKKLMAEFGKTGTAEAAVAFSATSGIIGYQYKDHKYVSRINVRAKLAPYASTRLMTQAEMPVLHSFTAESDEAAYILIQEYTATLSVGEIAAAINAGFYYYNTVTHLVRKLTDTDPVVFETQYVPVTLYASLSVFFRYDSAGEWLLAGTVTGTGLTRTAMLPLKPRRCDHFEMKLTGTGDARIFSISRILELGADAR